MKKSLATLITLPILLTTTMASDHSVQNHSARVQFVGEVLGAKGCTIINNNNGTINMGSIYKGQLKSNGYSDWAEGSIELADCNLDSDHGGDIEAVELTILSGDPSNEDNSLWKNVGDARGVGVEVRITGSNSPEIVTPKGTDSPIEAHIDIYNNTASYKVEGRMVKASETIEPGSVLTTIHFEINYK